MVGAFLLLERQLQLPDSITGSEMVLTRALELCHACELSSVC